MIMINKILSSLDALKAGLEDGVLDPIEVAVKFKLAQDYMSQIKNILNECVCDAVTGKTVEAYGATITKVAPRAMYSYKHIPAWNDINDTKKAIEARAKRAATSGGILIDPETGEEVEPASVTYTSESYKVTFK